MLDKKIVYFIEVANEGSFSAASRKLRLSQAAISQQITLLESELSVKLFDRDGYRPVLTSAGKQFYQGCIEIQSQCDTLKNRLKEFSTYTIRIGFTGAFENRQLLNMVRQFKGSNPNIAVSFEKNSFKGCAQSLLTHKIDVGFGLDSEFKHHDSLAYEKLFQYEICIICAHSHPLAVRDQVDISELVDENFIVLSAEYGEGYYRDFMSAFKLDGIIPQIQKHVNSFDELVFNVSTGDGIAIVSRDVVRESEVKVLPLRNSHHSSHYAVAYHRSNQDPILQKFIREACRHFETL